MSKDLTWVAIKIKQLLDRSPYIFDFSDYISNERNPAIIYKDFIVSIDDENEITLGIQPTMNDRNRRNELVEKLEMMVDKVNVKHL